ncbi:MAG: T9SS type A sorting domain-containing protein, partial [Flavobacteriaceae bacterium]
LELSSGTNLVAYLDDDDIEYLNSSNNWATASANGNGITYTWSVTAISTDWNTAGNWSGGTVPSATKLQKVIIPSSSNYPSISTEIRVGKLDLNNASSEITIEDGGTLNVYYDLTNSGTIKVEDNGSLILQDNEAVNGAGSYVIDRDTPNYSIDDFYSIWSTPVAEGDSEIGTIFTNNIVVFEYDASQNPSAYVNVSATADMELGKGYFIKSDDDNGVLTRTFNGTINNGNVDETIYFNSTTDNFNLIGNPYPSAIDWLTFHGDNSTLLNGTMYYWSQTVTGANNSASDFISFNSTGSNIPGTTGEIATGQGIFVKSNQAGTATFKNTHRVVGNNDQFFRNANNPDDGKSWFKLSGDNGFSSILIGFLPGATDGYEGDFDGEFVNEGSAIEFYSLIDGNKYAIQGRPELENGIDEEVPLGLEVTTAGNYTISIFQEFIDPNFDIILDDTLENIQTDLRSGDYTFNIASPSEINDRFILRYNYNVVLGISEELDSTNVKAYFSNDILVSALGNSPIPEHVELLNLTGQSIIKGKYSDRIRTNDLPIGVYIVHYHFNQEIITKKLLKTTN